MSRPHPLGQFFIDNPDNGGNKSSLLWPAGKKVGLGFRKGTRVSVYKKKRKLKRGATQNDNPNNQEGQEEQEEEDNDFSNNNF